MKALRIKAPLFLKLKKPLHFYIVCLVYLLSTALFSPAEGSAYERTFAWDANEEPTLEGYNIYSRIGNPCPPYNHIDTYPENELANPLWPMVKISDLEMDTKYYFVVTAYDIYWNESGYSNIIYLENGHWGRPSETGPV